MIFFKKCSLLLFVLLQVYNASQAQNNMYIHKKSGTLVIPVTDVDSIVYYATKPILSVTELASSITTTAATSGGSVNADGGEPITVRGVCWNTTSNPTIADKITEDGSGTGSFISYLTGLLPNTTYYVRSYATNSIGTGYGSQKSFTSLREYLSALTLKNGETDIALSPAFEKTISAYTAIVANSVSSLTVTPITESASSTVTVNGVLVESGASSSVDLSVGSNSITIIVYEDGIVQQVYDINVTRTPNANLTFLNVMSGATNIPITPSPFSSNTLGYTATVEYDISSVTLTPTSESNTCTITVNGISVANGSVSTPINLTAGATTTIPVVVSDNGSGKTYTISITRGSSTYLTWLTLQATGRSSGTLTLSPGLSRTNLIYYALAATNNNGVIITPYSEDASAIIRVNGNIVASGSASTTYTLNPGSTFIPIVVSSSTGNATRTYSVYITK